jgi:hypothetical protein
LKYKFLLPAVLLTSFAALSFLSSLHESPTFDEPLHIAGGYMSWVAGDHSFDLSNPPLVGYWAALPLLALRPPRPAPTLAAYGGGSRSFSFEFLSKDPARLPLLLQSSRAMMLILSLLLGWILWRWSWEILGTTGAIGALTAFAFCPMLLSHGHLVTSDIAGALGITWTLYRLWRWRENPSLRMALWTGLALALALCSKYSATIVLPIGLLALWLGTDSDHRRSFWNRARLAEAIVPGAVILISWALLYKSWGAPDWIAGLRDIQRQFQEGHATYFWGHVNDRGSPAFFVVGLLLKTPIPFLLSLALATVLAVRRPGVRRRNLILWSFIPAAAFTAAASFATVQVGLRHVLVVYPLACLWIGYAVATLWHERRLAARAGLIVLAAWYIGGTLVAFPNYLAYFNEAAGGSRGGLQFFADSNLDWGQGLRELGLFIRKEGLGPVYLSYFGCVDPAAYGISYQPVLMTTCSPAPGNLPPEALPDYLAISATNRAGVYYHPPDAFSWLNRRKPMRVFLGSIYLYDLRGDLEARERVRRLSGRA